MLHVHNVAWLGGVSAFIADLAATFPQFQHVSLYHRPGEHYEALQMLNAHGVKATHIPQPIMPKHIEWFNPSIIAFHNVAGIRFEGKHPWIWLRKWPTINWHHSAVKPVIQADLHVFVSEHVKSIYGGLIKSGFIHNHLVVPPCIQASKYDKITGYSNPSPGEDFIIGKIGPAFNEEKHPSELLEIAKRLGVKLLSPGSNKWYKEDDALISPEPSWERVGEWLSKMAVFLFMNVKEADPETWCRAVTEAMAARLPVVAENAGGIAEQITDMKNGILVGKGDFEEAHAVIRMLKTRPVLRRDLGIAARSWVEENASIEILRDKLAPHIIKLLTRGISK